MRGGCILWRPVLVKIGPLHDPVTWYGINYTGTQVTQWDFQNKGTRTSPARLSFVLKVPLRNLRPSVIYSVPCDRIVQRAYCNNEIPYHVTGSCKGPIVIIKLPHKSVFPATNVIFISLLCIFIGGTNFFLRWLLIIF